MTPEQSRDRPLIRSYVRRVGRITPAQREALDDLLSVHGVPRDGPLHPAVLFGRRAPCWLEIGFGDGEGLLDAAAARPDVDFLGIEVHDPGVGRALRGIEARGLTNVRVLHGDAVIALHDRIAPDTLDRVMLFFPDPWPKKRHNKRRIVQPAFVSLVASRLAVGGQFHCATDWVPYAEHMMEVLEAEPALTNAAGPHAWSAPGSRGFETRFERRGLRLGHEVRDLIFERCVPADPA